MKLILLGAPGSGKGTQSMLLCERMGIPSISTGSILREACRQKTPLGKTAESFISKGLLVPDEVVIRIIEERLGQEDCLDGYILDGFPRTIAQAEAMGQMLTQKGQELDAVINLQVNDDELIKRLAGRRMCSDCGAGYHLFFAPSKKEGICDRCHGVLFQRDDDKEETILRRLKVYKEQTAPLITYYQREGVLRNVVGVGETTQIFTQVMEELKVA